MMELKYWNLEFKTLEFNYVRVRRKRVFVSVICCATIGATISVCTILETQKTGSIWRFGFGKKIKSGEIVVQANLEICIGFIGLDLFNFGIG